MQPVAAAQIPACGCVAGAVLDASHMSSQLSQPSQPPGRRYCYPHVTGERAEAAGAAVTPQMSQSQQKQSGNPNPSWLFQGPCLYPYYTSLTPEPVPLLKEADQGPHGFQNSCSALTCLTPCRLRICFKPHHRPTSAVGSGVPFPQEELGAAQPLAQNGCPHRDWGRRGLFSN